jgi:hypothetical protein
MAPRGVAVSARRAAAALALAAALPVSAYILPVPGILRRLAERRAALHLDALEVHGTLTARGAAAEQLVAAAGLRAAGRGEASAPARFQLKVPGRCRLEIVSPDVADGQRPYVAVRDSKVSGPLAQAPGAAALVRSACALLAVPPGGEPGLAHAAALSRQGVALGEATLGRFDGRIAYVVGGRQRDAKPLLFVEKDGFQPLRLVSAEGKELVDVRLVGWGSPTGGDWFPRAVEIVAKDVALLRFDTEKASANPKLADALFE